MPSPPATHSSICGAQEKMDRVLRFLLKALAGQLRTRGFHPRIVSDSHKSFVRMGGTVTLTTTCRL
jgi:hypothetical protein